MVDDENSVCVALVQKSQQQAKLPKENDEIGMTNDQLMTKRNAAECAVLSAVNRPLYPLGTADTTARFSTAAASDRFAPVVRFAVSPVPLAAAACAETLGCPVIERAKDIGRIPLLLISQRG